MPPASDTVVASWPITAGSVPVFSLMVIEYEPVVATRRFTALVGRAAGSDSDGLVADSPCVDIAVIVPRDTDLPARHTIWPI